MLQVSIQACVNKSWKTSMEVGVKVEAESPLSNNKIFVAHAYLTFVALSPLPSAKTHLGRIFSEFQTVTVPELLPLSIMEQKRYEMAETRRQARFNQKKPDHSEIRKIMKEWSQGLREMADTSAPIKRHPGYFSGLYSSPKVAQVNGDEEEDEEEEEEEEEKVTLARKRRFSQDPRMMQQIKERPTDYTFAEVVELVMPQHANTLKITFGGQIMAWMEVCALASANRLAKAYLLTAR